MTNSLTEPLIEGNGTKVSVREEKDVRDGRDVNESSPESGWVLPELTKQFWIFGPMVCVMLLQYSLNLASVMFVGHLGELALASASMGTSIANVTGFSLLVGMGSALETLCGQAYGAKQYHLLGTYMQRGIIVLQATSVPIAVVWFNISSILKAMGQDPEIANGAGHYIRWMLPSLFGYAMLQPVVKYLQTQSKVVPMMMSSAVTLCFHIPTCWLLVYKLGVGFKGAAISNGISTWLNLTILVMYVKFGPVGKQTWAGFTTEAFHDMKTFFKLAIPSTLMICLEYWSFELMVLMSGLLPNPQLEMSTFTICLNTIAVLYMIPYGLGASASVRVSNELGAGRPSIAKKAVVVALSLGLTEGFIMATVVFLLRYVWPRAFTNEAEVVDYVAGVIPYLSVLAVMDSVQGVLSGVARGVGNQALAAIANLGAYYVVGVPLALVLAFYFHMNGIGLWLGLMAALAVQATGLFLICVFTDWEKQSEKARARAFADRLPTDKAVVPKDDSESPLIQQSEIQD
ncbi:unnamed protein product [Calypogeia fissa]